MENKLRAQSIPKGLGGIVVFLIGSRLLFYCAKELDEGGKRAKRPIYYDRMSSYAQDKCDKRIRKGRPC